MKNGRRAADGTNMVAWQLKVEMCTTAKFSSSVAKNKVG